MGINTAIDISKAQKNSLLSLLKTHLPNTKVWAYGSRVKYSARPNSDLDLVIFANASQTLNVENLKDALVQSDLPFSVDLLVWDNIPERFQSNIKTQYVELQSDEVEGLPSGWRVVAFSDTDILKIEDGDRGSNYPKQHEFRDTGFCLFLNTGNVSKNGFQFSKNSFIEQFKDNILRKGKLIKNDIVLTTRGTVGNVGIYDSNVVFKNIRINSGMVILRSNILSLYPPYLYQFTRSKLFSLQIIALTSGSAQPQLPIRDLKKVEINLPPPPEQKAIAHILGKLDDKIELNRQINQTLETMAQMLFKSWFVDFDPVIDNAIKAGNKIPKSLQHKADKRKTTKSTLPKDLQALFPDSFVFNDTLKKWIPNDWEVTEIDKLVSIVKGKSYKSSELQKSKTALVTLKSFKRGGGYRLDGLKEYTGQYKNEQEVFQGDLIIAYTDVTQAADVIGKPALIIENKNYDHLVISLDVAVIRPNNQYTKYFIYGLTKTNDFQMHNYAYSTGTTVLHLHKNAVRSYLFPNPSKEIVMKYSELMEDSFNAINENIQQTQALTKLRDNLLPKLISGKIRIPYE